jgi:hypothetical protein
MDQATRPGGPFADFGQCLEVICKITSSMTTEWRGSYGFESYYEDLARFERDHTGAALPEGHRLILPAELPRHLVRKYDCDRLNSKASAPCSIRAPSDSIDEGRAVERRFESPFAHRAAGCRDETIAAKRNVNNSSKT